MIELVDEAGYDRLTVRGLARRAHVSSGAFYAHFQDIEECFLATYDLIWRLAAHRLTEGAGTRRGRRPRLQSGFEALAAEMVADRQAARFALIGAPAAGPGTLKDLRGSARRLGRAIESCLRLEGARSTVPPLLLDGVVSGIARLARLRLVDRDRVDPDVAAGAARWVFSLLGEGHDFPVPTSLSPPPDAAGEGDDDASRPAPGDERAMILNAVLELGAERGYGDLSVPRIRRAAGVSRQTFDRYFTDVEDCFLAAWKESAERVLEGAASRGVGAPSWAAAVFATIEAICRGTEEGPGRPAGSLVELFATGALGFRLRGELIAEAADLLQTRAPAGLRLDPIAAEASAEAIWALLQRGAEGIEGGKSTALLPTLSYFALAPSIGAAAAVASINGEYARRGVGPAIAPWPAPGRLRRRRSD